MSNEEKLPIGFVDWNQYSLDELIEHLENKFGLDSSSTSLAVFKLIDAYKKSQAKLKLLEEGDQKELIIEVGKFFVTTWIEDKPLTIQEFQSKFRIVRK